MNKIDELLRQFAINIHDYANGNGKSADFEKAVSEATGLIEFQIRRAVESAEKELPILESIVMNYYAEDFGTYDYDGIAEHVLRRIDILKRKAKTDSLNKPGEDVKQGEEEE